MSVRIRQAATVFAICCAAAACGQADRSAVEFVQDRRQHAPVHQVEAVLVHFESPEGVGGGLGVDDLFTGNLDEVADPPQQPVGDPRGAS